MGVTRRAVAAGLALAGTAPDLVQARAQKPPPKPTAPSPQTRLFLEGRYLPVWRAIQATPKDSGLAQMASFVGDEAVALAQAGLGPGSDRAPLPDDAVAQDALAALVAAARDRRVVMLNEAHVASRHRHFLGQVLAALRPLGFDILAAEDFLNDQSPGAPDVRTFKAGAALDPGYGFYLHDPRYAEAVREAAVLGYRLAPYEQRRAQRVEGETRIQAIARRETAEADNFIADVLTPNPDARILVYCGYSHLRKAPDAQDNVWFARRLRDKTGIDPLCVAQAYTGSFGPHAEDRPLTQAVLARFKPAASIVVRSGAVVLGAEEAGADLAVFHPRVADVAGRPGWLAADPSRHRVEVAVPRQDAVVIVQAIHAVEPDKAIPADQQVLAAGARSATLFLRPGNYRLRLETDAGLVTLKVLTVAAA